MTKPQIAQGSHPNFVIPQAIVIPLAPSSNPSVGTFTSRTDCANYNPMYGRVQRWLDTTRFWQGGLTGSESRYTSDRATFDTNEQAEYLNTYGFARIQYGLPEPRDYNLNYSRHA